MTINQFSSETCVRLAHTLSSSSYGYKFIVGYFLTGEKIYIE